jgi:PAS domain S-box-containing protein
MFPIRRHANAARALRLALGIGALYAVVGATWIFASDGIVVWISADPAWLFAAQRYKGLLYVGATAAALVLLVRAGYQRLLGAAEQARSRELQVQDLFSRHPQPMWVYDRSTLAFLKVNEAAVHQYGYSEAEFRSMTIKDIRPPEDIPKLLEILAAPRPDYREVRHLRHRKRSGEVIAVRLLAYSVPYEGRTAVMAEAMDITREILAQQALERQEAQFRQLHQSLGEVLWLARADARDMLYVSPAFESLYGRPVAEFLRDQGLWLAVVHPDDRQRAAASAQQLLVLGSSSCEYRICRPDGSIRWVADRKKAIVDDSGLVQMIGGIVEDITAQKERDAARAVTQDELEAMVAERTAALERVNAELDAFARTAAHDMKSPLNAIAGYSQLVQHKYGPHLGAEGSAMVARIEQATRDMATLINDLLSLSRLTSAELQLRDVDLAALGREIVAGFRHEQPQRRVTFDAPAALVVRCDAGLTRSLMANLLGNAWKFTGRQDEAWIRLAAADTGRGTEVCVRDNGAGFDIGDGGHLFKPFKRFHTAAEFSGTGLGLVTCQRIVQRHGGEIRVESAPGQGTAIHFTLGPAARAQGAAAPPGVPQPRVVRPPAWAADPDPSAGTAVGETAHPSGDRR